MPTRPLGGQVVSLLVALQCLVVLGQHKVLVAKQQVGLGIGRVDIYRFVQQLDSLLILPHYRFLHRPLEQRLAFRCLTHSRQRQQKQQ